MQTSEEWKTAGNNLYRDKDYAGAIKAYAGLDQLSSTFWFLYETFTKCFPHTAAIELDPTSATLYTNRAAAHVMLLQHKEVLH